MNLENLINQLISDRNIVIGAICRVRIDGNFFLIVDFEIGTGPNAIDRIIVIQISQALFTALIGNVPVCEVRDTIPTPPQGTTLQLRCTFVVGNEAFIVFEIENAMDRIVIVRSDLCTVI